MEEIMGRLDMIERKLDLIMERLQENGDSCQKMSQHIDFIETAYQSLRSPLDFIRSKLSSSSPSLPQLEASGNEI